MTIQPCGSSSHSPRERVRPLIRRFDLYGFKALEANRKAGANWKFTNEPKNELTAVTTRRPRGLGLPGGR
ncbi:MAG TPA: hypothetical protein VMH78_03235 [Thermoplasmata archaeon]|nr:hypothetical protein [Thermoplasmata archaeon]